MEMKIEQCKCKCGRPSIGRIYFKDLFFTIPIEACKEHLDKANKLNYNVEYD